MPFVLTGMPRWALKGRRESHPYDEWFDGKPRLFIRGEDFDIARRSMATRLRAAAKRRGLKVTIAHRQYTKDDWDHDGRFFEFQENYPAFALQEGDECIVVQAHLSQKPKR